MQELIRHLEHQEYVSSSVLHAGGRVLLLRPPDVYVVVAVSPQLLEPLMRVFLCKVSNALQVAKLSYRRAEVGNRRAIPLWG